MDKIIKAAEEAVLANLAASQRLAEGATPDRDLSLGGDAESFSGAANGAMAVLTLAVHNKGDVDRKSAEGGLLN